MISLASLRFAGDLPAWLVIVLAIAAVLGVLALYLRETASLAMPYKFLLPSLRATAVAMVVFILAGPIWHRRQVVGTLGRVIFAVDTSQSMSLGDSQSRTRGDDRLQRATSWLTGDTARVGWLESIAKTHSIDIVQFGDGQAASIWSSDDGQPLPKSLTWSADGEETDLASPLESVISSLNLGAFAEQSSNASPENLDGVRRSAVVLMTDGRDTASRKSSYTVELAGQLASAGTQVNALGFGSTNEPPDVGVVEVRRPDSVAAEGKLAGQVVVKRFGASNAPVTVRIESGGETVWEKRIPMSNTNGQAVPFELDVLPLVEAARKGSTRGIDRTNEVLKLVAKVEASEDDFIPENNLLEFRVSASTRNRRVLIVDSSSRWETRYLKNLFVRDPVWDADVVLFGEGTSHPQLPRGDKPGMFPQSASGLGKYDAIIMGEIDADQWTTNERDRIVRFVATGGGLVIIDGQFGRIRSLLTSELSELMPVRFVGPTALVEPKQLRLTSAGLNEPVMSLIDQRDALAEFWETLPAPRWASSVALSDGAESWGEYVLNNGRSAPWLSTRMYGAGRVFYLASDQTWRWRYKVADRFHAKFWNQLMVAAMEPPFSASDQFVSLGTDKVEYQTGESIEVRARLRDIRSNPVSDATVDALVMDGETIVATIAMSVTDPSRATYSALVPPLPSGEYSIRIRASGYDESALLATTPIWVSDGNQTEMQRLSQDQDALQQIAEAGEGIYVHESNGNEMLERLKPLSSGTIVETDTILWQSYWWFTAIIVLLAVEWWCRKRAGLV